MKWYKLLKIIILFLIYPSILLKVIFTQPAAYATQFNVADVVPIEEYKVEPPQQTEDEKPQTNTTEPSIEEQQKPEKPQLEPQQTQEKIILDALTISTIKYPWVVNPTDNFTFAPQLFKPNQEENYLETDLRVRFDKDDQIINKFTYAHFPQAEQFYWVLEQNRIVIETKGSQAGIVYQGRTTDTKITENVTSSQAFWGLQSLSIIPVDLRNLTGKVDTQDFTVTSIAGQIINPEGIPAGQVIINSGVNTQDPNVTVIKKSTPMIGNASTLSSQGGEALFKFLDSENAPPILQGFPTTNLQPLLDDGNIKLQEGEIIPNRVLEASGILWGDILTGKGFNFTAPISSFPGIKIAQSDKFSNDDLLNIAVNPSLSPTERDYHYLNSLLWVSLGKRKPEVEILSEQQESYGWHKFYISYPHNRSIIQYDPIEISATYSNIFANPGLSITASLNDLSIDSTQTFNSILGMALGAVFEVIKIDDIDASLAEARQKFKDGEGFVPLNTTATDLQKRQINQRLNQALSYANSASDIEQISGTFTFPSKITPHNSTIFQVRTGTHKRVVQFLERDIAILREGDSIFSDLRLSNRKFGPLSFIGVPVPLNNTAIQPVNESSAVEVILTNSESQIVQQFSSGDNTNVPLNVRSSDLAFDYIELTRVDLVQDRFKSFNGYLSLPSVEFLFAGSSGDFNYSATLGSWFNINPDSAPNVDNNNLGLQEPTVGLYTNFLLNYIKTNVHLDSQKKPVAVNTHIPFLKIDWNSAANRNNPFSTFVNYLFQHQGRKVVYYISPGIAFIEDNSNGNLIGLLNGGFGINTGFNFKTNLEIGKDVYYELQSLQKVNKNYLAGLYLRNYSLKNIGLNTRLSGLNYGVILRHVLPNNNVYLETEIGTGSNGFDFKMQGSYRF